MRDRHHAGFSLTELLIVVGIIAIMTAAAAPNILAYMRNYSVRAATSTFSAEMQRARSKAVQRNTNNGVLFVITSNRQFRFYPEDANPGSAGPSGVRRGFDATTAEVPKYLPENVEFVPAGDQGRALRFNRLGQTCRPDAAAVNCPNFVAPLPPPQMPGTTTTDTRWPTAANYLEADPNGGWFVTVEDVRTRVGGITGTPGSGITRRIWISPGGRVTAQQ